MLRNANFRYSRPGDRTERARECGCWWNLTDFLPVRIVINQHHLSSTRRRRRQLSQFANNFNSLLSFEENAYAQA